MTVTRSEFIKVAISDIIAALGGRDVFYKKLAATYPDNKVTRATVSQWIKKGEIPASKAAHVASWSGGKYAASQICSNLAVE
jgi:hypothetical protein